MEKKLSLALFIFITLIFSCKMDENVSESTIKEPLNYPVTFRDSSVIDNYFGQEVADPFRWLEDDNSDVTLNWVKAQNELTFGYLDKIPFRDKVKDRLTEILNYERYGTPFKKAEKYYYFKNDGLQNQSVMYVMDSLGGESNVVLDPNTLSEDGTIALGGINFDKAGTYLGYLTSIGGSDWKTAQILELSTGKVLEDKIDWIKFSGLNWHKDGFFYSRYPAPDTNEELTNKNEFHKLYYHKLGTNQEKDVLWYEEKDFPNRNIYASISEDERFLIVNKVESSTGNALSVFDLELDTPKEIVLIDSYEKEYSVFDNDGDFLYVLTNFEAPNMRVMKVDINNPGIENWVEIIPEITEPLKGISVLGKKLFVSYLKNAYSQVKVYDMAGKFLQDFELPGIGSAGGFSGEKDETEAFFSFSSYTIPPSIYMINTADLSYNLFKKPQLKFDTEQFATEQIWYSSKDGTKIPMFITHKKGLEMNGENPLLLYGYGGFDVSVTPGFSASRLPLLENDGILVVANIRGGGEFGEEWHLGGTLANKQNVFDDFIAAAEYLIENKYTSPSKLAIQGGSNGGLLVGACMTQRPDLFAVAFPQVGVLDMLRYHKFTIGWAWATDYGSSEEEEAFKYLYAYSPLHNVKNIEYPATLVTTADHDDRVVPAHSFKFISELQHNKAGVNPALIRIETSAGHGAGKPISKHIEETADIWSFMWYNMGLSPNYK